MAVQFRRPLSCPSTTSGKAGIQGLGFKAFRCKARGSRARRGGFRVQAQDCLGLM